MPGTDPVRTLVIGIACPQARPAAAASVCAVPEGALLAAGWLIGKQGVFTMRDVLASAKAATEDSQ